MRFLGAGETARMDPRRRDDILALISTGREIEAATLLHPRIAMASEDSPIDQATVALASAMKTFAKHDPVVRAIETRLQSTAGSKLKDLSGQEKTALSEWTHAVDQMGQAVEEPSPASSVGAGTIFLIILAAGAILAPALFIGSDASPDTPLPSRFGPPPLHPSIGPTIMHRGGGAGSSLFPSEGGRGGYGSTREGGRPIGRSTGLQRRLEYSRSED